MSTDLYIIQRPRPKSEGSGLAPLGTRAEVLEIFALLNTAPDRPGGNYLYGPGVVIELPPGQDPVVALTIEVSEPELWEELFMGRPAPGRPFRSLSRTIRSLGWELYNPVTDVRFPPPPLEDEETAAGS